ncbi:MAG TPA: molybdopterin-dependent oxidoreductase [Thermoplasmata archaeon]|nr:molybdopterin-dependent oxidoreductase [Thermoplasmata archaeon]
MPVALRALLRRVRAWPWARFAAGCLAGVAALVVTFLLRVMGLGAFLPEVALEAVVTHIPGSIESFFIASLGEGAKLLGLASAVVAVLAAFGIGALFFRRIQNAIPQRWAVIMVYTLGGAAVILLVVLPLLGAGFLGSETESGASFAAFSQLVGTWLYAAVIDYLLVDVAARHPEGFGLTRRQFILGGAAALAAFAVALYGLGSVISAPARLRFASALDMFAKEVTPTGEFYVVTKNVLDPKVEPTGWRLTVGGLVASPLTLSLADLQGRMQTQEFATMECVSNEVGGNLIGTAKWSGLRLADLLAEAGVQPGADWVQFSCADGYTVAIPLVKAMEPATLLVLAMNDAPLHDQHGAPARILVPGKYGMFSAKWVTQIRLVQGEFKGFWQDKGWTNDGRIRTTAIIATPAADSVVASPVTIGGVALSDAQGISKVEVSTDGGSTWSEAQLHDPKDPLLTWRLWTFSWTPPGAGAFRIRARATDGPGNPQDPAVAPPYPNGSSGYDGITLYVNG